MAIRLELIHLIIPIKNINFSYPGGAVTYFHQAYKSLYREYPRDRDTCNKTGVLLNYYGIS
jgi:hypothetical protein